MSGEVTLLDGGDGAIARLVHTAERLFRQPEFAPAALVGGLAVMIRVGTARRATVDVDTVTGGEAPGALLLDYVGHGATVNGLVVDGVVVDVLPTEELPTEASDLPDEDDQRLFLLGHRWALESAEGVTVRAVEPSSDGSAEVGRLIVATTPALVACKFHALADRRGTGLVKCESDASDLVQLIGHLVRGDGAVGFAGAPFDLVDLVRAQTERWFLGDALKIARWATNANATPQRMNTSQVETIGRLLIERLDALSP